MWDNLYGAILFILTKFANAQKTQKFYLQGLIFVKSLGQLQCLGGAVLKTAPALIQNAILEYPQTTLRLVNLLESLAESC